MDSLHETEIDGVRCFWADSGRPTLNAALLFRQGMADEEFHESGWLHLLEHLCLHGRGGGVLDVNGSVTPLETTFDFHGPPERVTTELQQVAAWLADPNLDELEREKGVLRAEARLRGGVINRALAWRYGARGPGMVNWDEPGLVRATAEGLAARAARVFTTGNAVLCLSGPPPKDLKLPLRAGTHLAPQPAVPCESGPHLYVDEAGLVLSGVIGRSEAATWVPPVLQRALVQRFRDELGSAYSPFANYTRVDLSSAVVVAGSDVLPEMLPQLADTALDLVERVKAWPVPSDWMTELRDARLQQLADPNMVTGQVWGAGWAAILGERPKLLDELVEETRNITNDDVHAEIVNFADSLLLALPGKSAWKGQLPKITFPEGPPITDGLQRRSINAPADSEVFAVSDRRIAVGSANGARELHLQELVGMYVYPDGGRVLVDKEGWTITFEPLQWRRPAELQQQLDAVVPAHLHLAQPERPAPKVHRQSFISRWWGYLRTRRIVGSLVIGAVLVIVIGGWIALSPRPMSTSGMPKDLQAGLGFMTMAVAAGFIVAYRNRSR